MSEFSRLRGNEGYGACGDAVPPRAPKITDIQTDVRYFYAPRVLNPSRILISKGVCFCSNIGRGRQCLRQAVQRVLLQIHPQQNVV